MTARLAVTALAVRSMLAADYAGSEGDDGAVEKPWFVFSTALL